MLPIKALAGGGEGIRVEESAELGIIIVCDGSSVVGSQQIAPSGVVLGIGDRGVGQGVGYLASDSSFCS